jgi:hypothetical protein
LNSEKTIDIKGNEWYSNEENKYSKDDVYGEMLRWFDLIRSEIGVLKDN